MRFMSEVYEFSRVSAVSGGIWEREALSLCAQQKFLEAPKDGGAAGALKKSRIKSVDSHACSANSKRKGETSILI